MDLSNKKSVVRDGVEYEVAEVLIDCCDLTWERKIVIDKKLGLCVHNAKVDSFVSSKGAISIGWLVICNPNNIRSVQEPKKRPLTIDELRKQTPGRAFISKQTNRLWNWSKIDETGVHLGTGIYSPGELRRYYTWEDGAEICEEEK